jgi:hypothetical protein
LPLVVGASGDYSITTTLPGEAPDAATGTWHASSEILTFRETGVSFDLQFNRSLVGTTLTISGADSEFDFNNDGTPEAANVGAVLDRL